MTLFYTSTPSSHLPKWFTRHHYRNFREELCHTTVDDNNKTLLLMYVNTTSASDTNTWERGHMDQKSGPSPCGNFCGGMINFELEGLIISRTQNNFLIKQKIYLLDIEDYL